MWKKVPTQFLLEVGRERCDRGLVMLNNKVVRSKKVRNNMSTQNLR